MNSPTSSNSRPAASRPAIHAVGCWQRPISGLVPADVHPLLPPDTAWHPMIGPAPHGVRPRVDCARRGCDGYAPNFRTPTSGSRWRHKTFTVSQLQEIYHAALGHEVSGTNLKRILLRREQIEQTGSHSPSGRSGGRPALQYRFRVHQIEVTDPFAVLRPPEAAKTPLEPEAMAGVLSPSGRSSPSRRGGDRPLRNGRGLVAYVIDVGLFNLMVHAGNPGVFENKPVTAKIIAAVIATLFAYAANREWTWRDRRRQGFAREYALFLLLNGVALVITIIPLAISRYVLDLDSALADNISANVIGVGLGTIFRFWSYRKWVFPRTPEDVIPQPLS